MMKENEKELSILLDKSCAPNAELSREELQQIDFLLGDEREDELVTQWLQQRWEKKWENLGNVNCERVFARMKQQMGTEHSKRLSFMQILYRSAAILLLPLLGLSAYFIVQNAALKSATHTEIVEVLDQSETQSRIVLSDGSIVTLKDGSRLNLKNNFSGNTREITLEGEAFFEIARNPNKPFIIHTGRIRTTVLGTSFSIKAIPGETSITVTVMEGKVKVEDGGKLLATLGANQQFIHGIEAEHWQEKAINTEHETGWQLHELIFSNMSFGDIAQELAVRYGVNIVFENEELKQRRITALLDNRDPIDEMLRFLCTWQQATYTVQGNTYTIR